MIAATRTNKKVLAKATGVIDPHAEESLNGKMNVNGHGLLDPGLEPQGDEAGLEETPT